MSRLNRRELLAVLTVFLTGGTHPEYVTMADLQSGIEQGVVAQLHVAPDRGSLPTPDERPAAALTNEGLYVFTEPVGQWIPFGYGTDEQPIGSGYFENLTARSMNGTVFASENVPMLPSIQTAVDGLTSDTDRDICIVGGENILSSPIDIPDADGGVSARPASIATVGDSYLTQADGANLDTIVRTTGGTANLDVTIDGNRGNNDTDVVGVTWANEQGGSAVRAELYDCEVGVQVLGNTETSQFDIYVNACGVGVEDRMLDGATPDENRIFLRGHTNDGPYYRKLDPGISTDLWLNVETCPGNAVEHRATGNLIVRGIIRSAGGHGIFVSEGDVVVTGTSVISGDGAGVVFDGGRGRVDAFSCNNTQYGVVVGATRRSNRVKILSPTIINVEECAVDIRRGRGNSLVDPQNVEAGENTGDAIRVGTQNPASAYIEIDRTHADKTIRVGDDADVELKWVGQLDGEVRGEMPAQFEGMWGYDSDVGSLVVHDGDGWTTLDGQSGN